MKTFGIAFFMLLLIISCDSDKPELPDGYHLVVVKEKIDTDTYSYFYVSEEQEEYWIASSLIEASNGDTLYYSKSIVMNDFESKTLERTFKEIKFISDISKEITSTESQSNGSSQKNMVQNHETKIDPIEGGLTISQIYKDSEALDNSEVMIKGEVVKFNADIMGRNWIHIQDGTGWKEDFDLLVTSKETVNVGDIIVVKGNLVLDQDFGHGYKYNLLLEEVTLVK